MAWTGFTDEELARMGAKQDKKGSGGALSVTDKRDPLAEAVSAGVRRGVGGGSQPAKPRAKQTVRPMRMAQNIQESSRSSVLPPDQRLATPSNNNGTKKQGGGGDGQSVGVSTSSGEKGGQGQNTKEPATGGAESQSTPQDVATVKELDEEEAHSRELSTLEQFQKHQKMIEERNKQKKQQLTKALSERQQRTKEEGARLQQLQRELSRLESALTADVGILRQRIETASYGYASAQRRFEAAEAEYVSAKMESQKMADLKESLTEHLYTIIYQSEVRKSKKLSELAVQLGLDPGDSAETPMSPEMPSLSLFTTSPSYIHTKHNNPTSPKSCNAPPPVSSSASNPAAPSNVADSIATISTATVTTPPNIATSKPSESSSVPTTSSVSGLPPEVPQPPVSSVASAPSVNPTASNNPSSEIPSSSNSAQASKDAKSTSVSAPTTESESGKATSLLGGGDYQVQEDSSQQSRAESGGEQVKEGIPREEPQQKVSVSDQSALASIDKSQEGPTSSSDVELIIKSESGDTMKEESKAAGGNERPNTWTAPPLSLQ